MGNHKIKTMTTRGLQLGAVSLLSAAISACGGGNGTTSSSSSSVASSVASSSVASSSSSSVVSSVSSSSSSSVVSSSSSISSSSSSSSVAPSSSSSSSSSSSEASGGDIASGAALFVEKCSLCHSDLGNGTYSFIDPNNLVKIVAPYSLSVEGLAQYITEQMPKDVPSLGFHPDQCVDQCATDTAAFIWSLRDDSGEGTSSSASSSSVASSSSSSSSSSSVASGEDFVVLYALNAGGSAYTAKDGTVFSGDTKFFSSGMIGMTADPIAETEDDVLYQSERWGLFSYNFPVAAGSYDVSLHMVEAWFNNAGTPGNRLFDVKVEGETLVDDFNPLIVAGHDVAHVIELPSVEVTDGELTLEFEASMDMANVAAIVVRGLEGSKGPEPEVDPGTTGTSPVPADCSGESAVTENDFVMIDGGQLEPAVGDAITMHGNWVTGNKWNAGAVLSVTDTEGGSAISFSNAGMYEGFKMFPSPRRPFTFTGIDLWIDAETGGQTPTWGLRVITPRDEREDMGGAFYTTWMRAGGTDMLTTTSECNLMSLSLPDSWIPEDGAKHFIWETKNGWQPGYSLNIRRMVLKDFRYID